jgi:hypothetical protein
MAQMGEIKEGYCTIHGYDWCKCLEAIENAEIWMRMTIINAKPKSKTTKATRPSTVQPETSRVQRKKNLPPA